jgi:hypothetical protein
MQTVCEEYCIRIAAIVMPWNYESMADAGLAAMALT